MQTTAWIHFRVEIKSEDGSIIKVDEVRKAFNSKKKVFNLMEAFQGSDLGKMIEMFAHMKMQVRKFGIDE